MMGVFCVIGAVVVVGAVGCRVLKRPGGKSWANEIELKILKTQRGNR